MKKISIQKIVGLCGFLMLFNACEEDRDIKIPPHKAKLVIHAYVQTGEFFKIFLGRTLSSTGIVVNAQDSYIRNAQVILYENGTSRDTLVYDSAQQAYISDKVIAVSGNTYKVTVEANGYPSVDATSVAPFNVITNIVSFRRNARVTSEGSPLDDVTFRFQDPLSAHNYYLVVLDRETPYAGPGSFFCVYTYDPVVEQAEAGLDPFESENCIKNRQVLFTDKKFNGSQKDITISGVSESLDELNYDQRIHRPFLKMYNVNAAFYQYIKDGISLDAIDDNPFVQPVNVSSNVHNGYGLFTVFSAVTDTLR